MSSKRPIPSYADVETGSEDYATRFSGSVGRWMLAVQEAGVRHALEGVSPGTGVLEVGGGHAQLIKLYEQLGLDVTVVGSGSTPGPILESYVTEGRVSWKQADLLDLPFRDRSFEVVLSLRLLSHFEEWNSLLRELCRVSASRVIVDYPSIRSVNIFAGATFGWKKRVEQNTRPFVLFDPIAVTRTLAETGFEVISESRQFLFPMALHRLVGVPGLSGAMEWTAQRTGLSGRFGSPVISRADRDRGVSRGR